MVCYTEQSLFHFDVFDMVFLFYWLLSIDYSIVIWFGFAFCFCIQMMWTPELTHTRVCVSTFMYVCIREKYMRSFVLHLCWPGFSGFVQTFTFLQWGCNPIEQREEEKFEYEWDKAENCNICINTYNLKQ